MNARRVEHSQAWPRVPDGRSIVTVSGGSVNALGMLQAHRVGVTSTR